MNDRIGGYMWGFIAGASAVFFWGSIAVGDKAMTMAFLAIIVATGIANTHFGQKKTPTSRRGSDF
jgi:hypothetical protein